MPVSSLALRTNGDSPLPALKGRMDNVWEPCLVFSPQRLPQKVDNSAFPKFLGYVGNENFPVHLGIKAFLNQ